MSDENPALEAMRQAMKAAEEAAERRRVAKLREQEEAPQDDNMEMLAELALLNEPVERTQRPTFLPFAIEEAGDLTELISEVAELIPDNPNEERHGDLVVMRHEAQAAPWYQEAAEAALPAALKQVAGPVDVKSLLQALIVEIGDVKRTNAIIMEQLTRMEEKVDRTNRQLKDRRFH